MSPDPLPRKASVAMSPDPLPRKCRTSSDPLRRIISSDPLPRKCRTSSDTLSQKRPMVFRLGQTRQNSSRHMPGKCLISLDPLPGECRMVSRPAQNSSAQRHMPGKSVRSLDPLPRECRMVSRPAQNSSAQRHRGFAHIGSHIGKYFLIAEGLFRNLKIPMERIRSTAPWTAFRESVKPTFSVRIVSFFLILSLLVLVDQLLSFDLPLFVSNGLSLFSFSLYSLILCILLDVAGTPPRWNPFQILVTVLRGLPPFRAAELTGAELRKSNTNIKVLTKERLLRVLESLVTRPYYAFTSIIFLSLESVFLSYLPPFFFLTFLVLLNLFSILHILTTRKMQAIDLEFFRMFKGMEENKKEKPLVKSHSVNIEAAMFVELDPATLGSVDSTTRILSKDFDAADNTAHLGRACQSVPVVSLSGNENRGEASKRECITERILGLEDLQQNSGGRRDNAAKSFGVMTEKENIKKRENKYDNEVVKIMEEITRRNRKNNKENKEAAMAKAKYLEDLMERADSLKFVGKETKEEKPLVEFDSANIKEYQSGLLEKTNSREESKRPCMTEKVLGSVDSTTRILSMDFDAADNTAHLGGACQSGPVVSLSGNENRGEASKRECITERILGLEDLQQNSGGRRDNAAESFGAIYDPGIHTTHSLAQNSIEVLEALPTLKQPNDCVPLSLGRLKLEGCVQEEKSQDLPRLVKINGVEQRVTKSPSYLGGFTAQSTSSSCWPISLPDGRHIVVLNPLEQSTQNVAHVARAPSVSLPEKMVRRTVKRKCRIMSVIYAIHQQHFGKRCEGTAKSFRAMHICRNRGINWVSTVKRIHKQHGINQWPFRQKWATRKGYSLGEKRPYEVSSQSMDEKLVSKFLFIHMSQFPTFSPLPLVLPNSSEIVGPIALSSNEFASTNNRAHLVRQNQSGSAASHYERKNTRETLGRQRITESLSSIEDLQQHFARKHKDAVMRLGVKVSIFKSSCRQHRVYWLPCQIIKSEQEAFDATSNIAHVVKVDQGIPTVSCSEMENKRESLKRECSGLSLEDLPEHYGGRHEDAMKGLVDSLAWKSFEVLESLPLEEQSIIRHFVQRRTPTHKDCVQRKKSQDLPRSLQMDCSRGLAAQGYSLGGERPGEVLSLSMEEKLVSRLQFLHMSWLARSSRHPLALQSGSEILGHIALSSSEFIATNNGVRPGRRDQGGSTNNGAHPGRQDQGGSSASHPERGRAAKERISLEDLEKLKGKNRDDAAKSLGICSTTFKNICRSYRIFNWKEYRASSPSIPPWPNLGSDNVFAPADPNGENNPSPTSNRLSTNGQITTDIEMSGPNSEPTECLPNSFGVPNFQNIGNGWTAGFGIPTIHDSHHVRCHDAGFPFSDEYNETEAPGGSGNFGEQDFELGSSINPAFAAPSQHVPTNLPTLLDRQIASPQSLRENLGSFEDRKSFLAPQIEPLPEGHVLGSVSCTIDSISDLAPSQPMSTTPYSTGSPEYLRDVLPSVVEHRMETNHYGSSNLIDPSFSNLAPSLPMQPTIPHMASLLTERQDSTLVKVNATYGKHTIKLRVPLTSGITELKQVVSKQLKLGLDSFEVNYKDEHGEWILITLDEEVREHLQLTLSGNQVNKLWVVNKVPNTTDFCRNCECEVQII